MTDLRPTPTDYRPELRIDSVSTFVEILERAAETSAGMNFYGPRGDLAEVLSYADLLDDARDTAGRLLALGLQPGDRVGLLAETQGDFVRAFMGAMCAGLAPSPMPLPVAFGAKDVYGPEILDIATVADIAAMIVPEDYLDWVVEPLESRKLRYIGPLAGLPEAGPGNTTGAKAEDLAYLQFSSGTTGSPKGVAVTHRGLLANLAGMQTALNMTGEDRGVSWLPFYHDMGLVGCVLMPIASRISIDYLATRDFIRRPGLWPTMISRARATMSYAPSFGYELAARRGRAAEGLNLDCWRIAGIGGDMIRSGNLSEFTKVYAPHGFSAGSFTPSYGMAELTLGLTFSAVGSGCRTHRLSPEALEAGLAQKPDTDARGRDFAICGVPLQGHEVEVRLPCGSPAQRRQIGQVYARGPSVMQGYFRDPAATDEILDDSGWLDTGDIGFLDENGELSLTGRAKDLIIVNGRNIWPQDVEWTMEQRIEGIRDGTVVAFSTNPAHDTEQERLTIVIEHRKGQKIPGQTVTEQADSLLRQVYQLSPIVALCAPGSLPRTSSGKLSRSKARKMYLSGQFAL